MIVGQKTNILASLLLLLGQDESQLFVFFLLSFSLRYINVREEDCCMSKRRKHTICFSDRDIRALV